MIFIIVFKNWGFFTDTAKYPTVLHEVASGSFATIIIIVGFASLFFAFIDWKCKIGREETPLKELEKEFLEFLKFFFSGGINACCSFLFSKISESLD